VKFVDWNKWIARQIKKVLKEKNMLNDSKQRWELVFYGSKL
jgi:hypothetical protein